MFRHLVNFGAHQVPRGGRRNDVLSDKLLAALLDVRLELVNFLVQFTQDLHARVNLTSRRHLVQCFLLSRINVFLNSRKLAFDVVSFIDSHAVAFEILAGTALLKLLRDHLELVDSIREQVELAALTVRSGRRLLKAQLLVDSNVNG